jgi:hypothetical protein
MSTAFCLGKQCKQLPGIVVEEEQTVTHLNFGANMPGGVDFKKRSAHDVTGD